MTSIPVNNAKSVLMDLAAKVPGKTQNTGETGSFTDVLKGQTEGGQNKAEPTKTETEPATKTQTKVNQSARDRLKQEKTAGAENTAEDQGTQEVADVLEKAGMEVVGKIAEELDISEEEVLQAMELLGLTAVELLQPQNLTMVVLQASGETDPMALVTGTELSGALKNLNQFVSDIRNELQAAFNISEEQLDGLLTETQMEEPAEEFLPTNETITEEKAPEIIVEDLTDGKKTEGQLKENTLVKEEPLESATLKENTPVTEDKLASETGKEAKQDTGEEHSTQNQSSFLQDLNQNVETQGAGKAETVPFTMQQTREIMNQIMDYMRVQIKPEMTQLEMQLHPESLGNVNVHIASKEGVITAQFTAQNETVRAALESQIVQLRETFAEQGVKVEAIEVSVQANGFRQEYEGSRERENTAEDGKKKAARRINLGNPELLSEETLSEEEQLAVSMMEANGNTVDYTA